MISRTRSTILLGLVMFSTAATAQTPPIVVTPDSLEQPSKEALWAAWPAEARSISLEGDARFRCTILLDGHTSDCRLEAESRSGLGFATAAAPLLPKMTFKPGTKDGAPTPMSISVVVQFQCHDLCKPFDVETLKQPLIMSALWLKAPNPSDVATAYPASASAAGLEGSVTLVCLFRSDGSLTSCKVAGESPTGHEFADAAKKLASQFQSVDKLADGKSIAGAQVRLPFKFSLNPSGKPGSLRGRPDLIATPSPGAFAAVYPAAALKDGVLSARTILACDLGADGKLTACGVASEDPAGRGFGEAALGLTDKFQMTLWSADGLPTTDGAVRIPITFKGDALAKAANPVAKADPKPTVIEEPDWLEKPSGSEFSQLYPDRAAKQTKSGFASIRCVVKVDGTLEKCTVLEEKPEKYGFGAAAVKMAAYFKMRPQKVDGTPVTGATVVIPISFTLH
jgi:TonB family protein